ncbi:hypothetical protein B0H11DRAFT_1903740 [Mycena galericulata]|nr:hypothetical protein B0H11DRAFT_1903740 [Mycena galericulata]
MNAWRGEWQSVGRARNGWREEDWSRAEAEGVEVERKVDSEVKGEDTRARRLTRCGWIVGYVASASKVSSVPRVWESEYRKATTPSCGPWRRAPSDQSIHGVIKMSYRSPDADPDDLAIRDKLGLAAPETSTPSPSGSKVHQFQDNNELENQETVGILLRIDWTKICPDIHRTPPKCRHVATSWDQSAGHMWKKAGGQFTEGWSPEEY